jgi:DNA modification methylase
MVRRIIEAFTNRRELVLDAFLGGGASAIEARALGRRFIGGDVNPDAVRFTAARLLSEHAWREEREPTLFSEELIA